MSSSDTHEGTTTASLTDEERLARASKVRDACGASFADAREALEACGYDVLDAVVWLERNGKVAAGSAAYSTAGTSTEDTDAQAMSQAQVDYERSTRHLGLERVFAHVWGWVKHLLCKGRDISFVAEKNGRRMVCIPLIAFVAIAIIAFWVVVPLIVIGLFCDVRYHFEGMGTLTVDVNEWSRKASDGAERLKKDVMDEERRQGQQ